MLRILAALFAIAATALAMPGPGHTNESSAGWQTQVIPAPVTTGSIGGQFPRAKATVRDHAIDGIASYYWQGQMTASGEAFDKRAMTAAHPTLPFGTKVEVINLGNGRKTVVRINDRGPFKPGRIIDVSEAAADELGMRQRGLAPVRLVVLDR